MSDIPSTLPLFHPPDPRSSQTYTLLLSTPLTLLDLLSLEPTELSRRSPNTPLLDIQHFISTLQAHLSAEIASSCTTVDKLPEIEKIPLCEPTIDGMLNGGFARGRITELVGAAGAGKTQVLLTLLAAVVGRDASSHAIYISTEAPLSTPRLRQILSHRIGTEQGEGEVENAMSRVHATTLSDLETFQHVLRYQLPIMCERIKPSIVIVDSIAANFRGEGLGRSPKDLAERGRTLVETAEVLRRVAGMGIAVVCANQVADRFGGLSAEPEPEPEAPSDEIPEVIELPSTSSSSSTQKAKPNYSPAPSQRGEENLAAYRQKVRLKDLKSLDYQSGWISGFPDGSRQPSLGMVWTNVLACRIVVRREEGGGGRRWMERVFCDWAPPVTRGEGHGDGDAVETEVWEGGVRGVDNGGEGGRGKRKGSEAPMEEEGQVGGSEVGESFGSGLKRLKLMEDEGQKEEENREDEEIR